MYEDDKKEQQINSNPYNGYSNGNFSGQSTYTENNSNSGSNYNSQSSSGSDTASSYNSQSSFGGSTPYAGGSYNSQAGSSQSNYSSSAGSYAQSNAASTSTGNYGSSNTANSSTGSYGSSSIAGSSQSSNFSRPGSYSGSGQSSYNYSYGQNNYSYGQNSYSYPGSQTGYGTYQYNTSDMNSQGPNTPPVKKKHTLIKVLAAVCAISLVLGGTYFAYAAARRSGLLAKDSGPESQTEQIETAKETENESSNETASNDSDIKTTTVTGETKAVVTDVTAVVDEVMPAMVMIHNNYTASASFFGYVQQQEATASGSGIIVGENDSELLIATNYHVIEGADTLEVIFNDDSTVEAVVKGTDSDMDLAVIAVMLDDISSDTRDTIKIATLGDSTALKLGEPAIAIGNALGYGQSVTTGVISALNRDVDLEDGSTQTFIQTDAAINPGNSGGALLNLQGEVIGINSNKIGGDTIEGMGYAIPISVAQPIIDKLMNEKTRLKVSSADRGYIGISGVSVTAEVASGYGIPKGVYVAEVTKGGGAEAAGLAKGDVITEFDGQEITSMDDLQTKLQYYAAGTNVTVKVMRQNGQEYTEQTYNVTLGHGATNTSTQDSNPAEQNGNSGNFGGGFMQPGFNGFFNDDSEEGDH